MIKINLLPEELRKAQKPKGSFAFKMPELGPRVFEIAGIALSVFVGLHLLFGISIILKGASLKGLNSKWQQLQPKRLEIDRLNSEIASLERKVLPLRQLVDGRGLWSRGLNQLSDLMSTGIWLTRFSVHTQFKSLTRTLNLEGRAAALYGDETALIAAFIKTLQENGEFSKYFKDMKLGPMEKMELEKNPVMNFKASCSFRKD